MTLVGPQIPGAPWQFPPGRFPEETAAPPEPTIENKIPKIGPPIPGAPWWAQSLLIIASQPQPIPRPPPTPGIPGSRVNQLLVPRDPKAPPRSLAHMDIVSAMLNSLIRRGKIVEDGVSEWTLVPDTGDTRTVTGPTGTLVNSDRGKLIVFNSSAIIYEAIVNTATLDDKWVVFCVNIGTHDVIITPDSNLINNARYLRLIQRQSCIIFCDGVDLWAFLGGAGWVDENRNTVIGDLAGRSFS